MSLSSFSRLLDPLDLGGRQASEAAIAAGQTTADALLRAQEQQQEQFDLTRANVSPFVKPGAELLPALSSGATASGLGSNINSILGRGLSAKPNGAKPIGAEGDLSGLLELLISRQTRDATASLGSLGQLRSGAGAEQVADIPSNLAIALEDLLNRRQAGVVGSAQNAAGGLGS